MGKLISLAQHRGPRRPVAARRGEPAFFFDLASPFTYLAAERVERLLTGVRWAPVLLGGTPGGDTPAPESAMGRAARARAITLRMPLVWPDACHDGPRGAGAGAAMRVAHYAAQQGRGAAFVLAAGRLAFCGGFDLEDPEILAEAAAAAGLPLEDTLRAAGEGARDDAMAGAGRRLLAQGADELPALQVRSLLFCGEHRLSEAAAAARADARGAAAETVPAPAS